MFETRSVAAAEHREAASRRNAVVRPANAINPNKPGVQGTGDCFAAERSLAGSAAATGQRSAAMASTDSRINAGPL
ncbi:hypothetical protein PS645_04193 [Pseudomonas fluorescens]|uniref:Uncharacterized protein n=1 Tax=Pseudomonas fluorescens TaxID=294 RepID=A0A5E6VWD5_PSEFL|nr:hypothetical protein PS645_04193 [Pseudomonas fluorescens]